MELDKAKQRAQDIISLRDREKARQASFRSLWQSVANLVFPQTYGITTTYSAGTELMSGLFDTTAVIELENMTSGITNNLFPAGQQFFAVKAADGDDDETANRYLSYLTEKAHEAIFNSNFIAQVNNTIQYWSGFGIGSLYSDWTARDGLNYRDYAIGTYQCLENSRGIIDTIILTCPKTARQIVEEFGSDPKVVGQSVVSAYNRPDNREDSFNVIQVIRPREGYSPGMWANTSMPVESVYVQEQDKVFLQEGGYDEFPFAIPRYQVVYREVYGRGRGVMMLPQIRLLNRLARDYLEMSNKWVNPPRMIHESFDGTVDVTPGANNYVTQMDAIAPINMGANGMYPVTKDILEYHRETIRQEGFFKNAFEALSSLSGDRRTTTEIIERLKEGMKKLSKPLGRLFTELLTPAISRSILLLIRNGVVERPPDQLQGRNFKLEFINPLALALRDQQSRGFQYWVASLEKMELIFPGVRDNVDYDVAYRDFGQSLGVKTDHIRSIEDRDRMRAERAKKQQQMEMAQMSALEAEGYNKATKAPESGSPAEMLVGA